MMSFYVSPCKEHVAERSHRTADAYSVFLSMFSSSSVDEEHTAEFLTAIYCTSDIKRKKKKAKLPEIKSSKASTLPIRTEIK